MTVGGVSVVAGLLLWASFPVLDWWFAAIAAFALLAWVLITPATTALGGLACGVVFGLACYLPLLRWSGDFVGVWPWLVLAAGCSLYPGVFGVCAVLVRDLPGWPIWFAALWAAQEWVKARVPFGGFPWGEVGTGQSTGLLLPVAAVGGVGLLSATVVLAGCTVTACSLRLARRVGAAVGASRHGRHAAVSMWLPGLCLGLIASATVVVWMQLGDGRAGPTVQVAVVQGNVPRLGLDFNAQRRAVLDFHVRETLRLAADVAAGRARPPRLVIWPENSSDIDPLTNHDAAQEIAAAAAAINAPILLGGVRAGPGWSREHPRWLNSVMVFDPRNGWGPRHDKAIIQPFGEYLPWPGLFGRLPYARHVSHFVPGAGPGVVHAAGVAVGVATCWEILFDRAPRGAVLAGAQLLAVPTNNATFDATMSHQQLAFAAVRAVEHHRYVLVAGTTGISAVIAPDGHPIARTGFNTSAYLDEPVHFNAVMTPATQWAPAIEWLLIGIGVTALAAATLTHRHATTPRHAAIV
ncbi:MAG TPA: apolipoprotein N-acyltransferase [Burkholderiaceae bacterium]